MHLKWIFWLEVVFANGSGQFRPFEGDRLPKPSCDSLKMFALKLHPPDAGGQTSQQGDDTHQLLRGW